MTAYVPGTLYRLPDWHTSESGRLFLAAILEVKDGNESQLWWVIGMQESVQAELMRLAEGDAISVQGAFKAELYDHGGEKQMSLSVIADNVLALRQRKAVEEVASHRYQ